MSSYGGGVALQETADVLTNLRIGQEMDAVHDFFDGNICESSQKDDSDVQGKSKNGHERPKCVAKKVTISADFKDDAKCKTTGAGSVKDLMNCIAFQKESDDFNDDEITSPDFLSTDTSSDVTDVTPRSSTSGCSSLSRSGQNRENRKNIADCSHNTDSDRKEGSERKPVHSLRFLKEVLDSTNHETLDRSNGMHKRKPVICKNMTFSKDQVRKIDRENQILLRKIEENFNRRPKCPTSAAPQRPRLSSSAVNRQRSQKKIAQDNLMLLKKIECVKSTISARVSVRKV